MARGADPGASQPRRAVDRLSDRHAPSRRLSRRGAFGSRLLAGGFREEPPLNPPHRRHGCRLVVAPDRVQEGRSASVKGMPMIKTILVAATGDDNDAATFAAALAVARPFAAHLDMLHVRLDAVTAAVAMTTDTGSGALTGAMIERLERDALQREA